MQAFTCPHCGADLEKDAGQEMPVCSYCGGSFDSSHDLVNNADPLASVVKSPAEQKQLDERTELLSQLKRVNESINHFTFRESPQKDQGCHTFREITTHSS